MTGLINVLADSKNQAKIQFSLVTGILLIGAAAAFPISYMSSSNFIIGFILFPFALIVEGKTRYTFGYLALAATFGFLAFFYDVKMFYFLSLTFCVVFMTEAFLGRINTIIIFLIAAMSPVFQQLAVILGFPIRLRLSEAASKILQLGGMNVRVDGNMMTLSGNNFAVDDACMGLNMLAISMLLSVFLLATQLKNNQKSLSIFYVGFYFLIVLILNITANLFRIILLVLFKIGPEDLMHDVVGLVVLLAYVIIPVYYASSFLVRKRGRGISAHIHAAPLKVHTFSIFIFLSLTVMVLGFSIDGTRKTDRRYSNVRITGMNGSVEEDGMSKFSDNDFLIYVKPIPEFFSGEHTPLFCWKGSGYEFEMIRTASMGSHLVYSGVLIKGNEKLHTAWWYSNGDITTVDQFTWRYTSLKTGKPFCLVNVTAINQEQLMDKVTKMLAGELSIQ